jgi:hypothetical protein
MKTPACLPARHSPFYKPDVLRATPPKIYFMGHMEILDIEIFGDWVLS